MLHFKVFQRPLLFFCFGHTFENALACCISLCVTLAYSAGSVSFNILCFLFCKRFLGVSCVASLPVCVFSLIMIGSFLCVAPSLVSPVPPQPLGPYIVLPFSLSVICGVSPFGLSSLSSLCLVVVPLCFISAHCDSCILQCFLFKILFFLFSAPASTCVCILVLPSSTCHPCFSPLISWALFSFLYLSLLALPWFHT